MLYYLAVAIRELFTPANVLTYNTVRAGGAAVTGFAISLLIGPTVIQWLRALKVGQYIRQEHVEDLHALHKGKAGTPTMGGALIIIATALSLLFWGRLDSRLLIVATGVFCALGAVGFLDDYIKLRRKHNKGLSAKAKFTGQILVGLLLGAYLVAFPIIPSKTLLAKRDIANWDALDHLLRSELPARCPRLGLSPEKVPPAHSTADSEYREALLVWANEIIQEPRLYIDGNWTNLHLGNEAQEIIGRIGAGWSTREFIRLNRLLLCAVAPAAIAEDIPNLHTKLEIPGLKQVFIPLGLFYILFVLVVIVGSSNAVNLTDGLDGLAIGASVISLMAYTAVAYVVSRSDWSQYLYLIYVPEASELFVFGAALLGTGLGFLWFNSHPAEVFMGDTGSLALGGALGTMAVLTKQELLLIVVGGLFVMEAGSVILQVGSFKLRGKRIFRMAPLHHHFELKGWSESKVTIRFWILAILFALLSLATLKLR